MNTIPRSLVVDLEKIALRQPDRVALLDGSGRIVNYRELRMHVEQAHAWFSSVGMRPGDVLLALMPNTIETVIYFLACLRGGYTYAPLPCTATIFEIERWKNLTRARLCLLADPVASSVRARLMEMDWKVKVADLTGELAWPEGNVKVDAVDGGRLIMASSGSTGEPKAILLDADRLWASANAFLRFHNIENTDVRFWNYLPMSYLGGLFNLTIIPLAAGGSIFIDETFSGKTFLVFWSTVERFRINSLWLVPTIMRGLLTLSKRGGDTGLYSNIEHCYLGTAPVSLEEKQRFHEIFGIQPLENYGLSETTFISSEQLQEIDLRRQGSVGTIMPDVEIKLVPVIEDDVSANEILVRTPYMMLGYLDEKGVVDPSVDAEGFLRTGDFGQIVDNQLQLSGRCRDIIKKGGILVALRELELIAETYPEVAEAAAVKVEHAFYGESCVLYVRTHEPPLERSEFLSRLGAWLREQLVRHKWPEDIIYFDDFPRTASGKVQKHLFPRHGNCVGQ